MDDYRRIADVMAADIAAGRLEAGARLPPQRRFARQRGIATSTAARVYGELVRRGLAVGEVGRGTFVRASSPGPDPALAEPSAHRVDLELNFSVLPGQAQLTGRGLAAVLDGPGAARALGPARAEGYASVREAAATLVAKDGWTPDPARILFPAGGRQAIATAIAALVPVGARLGVEALTYPVMKSIAARLGVTLVPLALDEQGLQPESLRAAHRSAPLDAVYLQPTLHNPLGSTMSPARRAAVAELLDELDMYAIEDGINGFLRPDVPPLALLAPERVLLLDSVSKRLAPGLTLGFIVVPQALREPVAAAMRSGGWSAQRFPLAAIEQLVVDGTAGRIQDAKRRDAEDRQAIVARCLAGFNVRSDPHAYHCWWELPALWRADTFVAAAARRGIAVSPAAAFAVGAAHAPNAVRLALASPTHETLAAALDLLAGLARSAPEDTAID